MAWSPVRRTNAGRFEVDHPGDYATLNSYHPVDGTTTLLTALSAPSPSGSKITRPKTSGFGWDLRRELQCPPGA